MANRPVTFHHISTIGILACAGPDAMCLSEDDTVPDRHIHLVHLLYTHHTTHHRGR